MPKILVVEDNANQREGLCALLKVAGFSVASAGDGVEALEQLGREQFDLMLVDVWMPRMNGLELLSRVRSAPASPKVIVMTADDTPETLLQAVREQAYQYIAKPFDPKKLVELVRGALAAPLEPRPIEVLSAVPQWVELLVPCEQETAERIQGFLMQLKADLPKEVREAVGKAFRELLLNAIEWGGELDPNRKVRIAYLRTGRMLLYHIADPGPGFRLEEMKHAAIANPPEHPLQHRRVRKEMGLRPGGFGILVAQTMADEVLYNEAGNEVLLIKYLDQPQSADE